MVGATGPKSLQSEQSSANDEPQAVICNVKLMKPVLSEYSAKLMSKTNH